MTTALVTRRDASVMRWIANWAEVTANPVLRAELVAHAKRMLQRPDVQRALAKIRAEQAP